MKVKMAVWACTCERCGATWISRVGDPKKCAKCKSPYWNRPRRSEAVEVVVAEYPMRMEEPEETPTPAKKAKKAPRKRR